MVEELSATWNASGSLCLLPVPQSHMCSLQTYKPFSVIFWLGFSRHLDSPHQLMAALARSRVETGSGARIRTWDRGSKVRCLTAWPHPIINMMIISTHCIVQHRRSFVNHEFCPLGPGNRARGDAPHSRLFIFAHQPLRISTNLVILNVLLLFNHPI